MNIAKFKLRLRKLVATFSLTALLASMLVVAPITASAALPAESGFDWVGDEVLELFNQERRAEVGSYELAAPVLKGDYAVLIARALGGDAGSYDQAPLSNVQEYAQEAANMLYALGIVQGEGGTDDSGFNRTLNRATAFQMVCNAAGVTGDSPMAELNAVQQAEVDAVAWVGDCVKAGLAAGLFTGDDNADNTLRLADPVIRAEAGVLSMRAGNSYNGEPITDGDGDGDTDGPVGGLKVSAPASQIATQTIPKYATSVPVAKFMFQASDEGDVTVRSLTLHKYGVSSLPSGFQLYLYDGDERLTSGRSVTSTDQNAQFNNVNVVVEKGESKEITVRADMGNVTTTGEFGVELVSADAVSANTDDVTGSFPVKGNLHFTSTTSVGSVTISKNGSVTNLNVGEDDGVMAKFKVAATTEDALVEQLGLYLTGTVATNAVENLELYVSGESDPVATAAGVGANDVVNFVFDEPYEIIKGNTKNFEVKGDLNTGRANDTVQFYIDEATDVLARGGTYGYGMRVLIATADGGAYDGTTCTSSSAANCTYFTIEGGDITVSSNGPVAQDIAVNGDDINLIQWNITSVSDITVKNFGVSLDTSSDASDAEEGLMDSSENANLTDIKIVEVNEDGTLGDTVMGPVDADAFTTALAGSTTITDAGGNDDAEAFYLFTDEFDMEAGESQDFALIADIVNDSALNDMTIVAELQTTTSYPEFRDINNKVITNSTSLVPTSVITGKTMTVKSQSFALSLASTPVSGNEVQGAQDVDFVGITMACGTASDCTLTDLTLTAKVDEDGDSSAFVTTNANTYVGSVRLEDSEGNEVAPLTSVQSDGTVVMSDIDYDFEAGETETFYVVGDISSNAYAGSPADAENIAFMVANTTDVTVEDAEGNTYSATGTVNTTPSVVITTTEGGSLTVAVDPDKPQEDIAVAGTTGVEVSKFRFTSTDEAFKVKKLSLNNRQLGVTTAALGNYDNNVVKVTVSYPNEAGETKTAEGTLTDGTALITFATGQEFYVPADDDATLTVMANLNTIQGGAQAGEFVDLNIAFNNFEAIAQGSGETYGPGKLDSDVAAGSDLDFGTMTFVDTTVDHSGGDTGLVAGAADTITVPDLNVTLPVGTLVKFGAASATYTEASEPLMVLTTKYTDGGTSLVGTIMNDDDATDIANGDSIAYALPGTGYLTDARLVQVYETRPTITLNSSSPSGSKSVSTTDNAFIFNLSAGTQERVQFRTAKELTACVDGGVTGANDDATLNASDAVAIDGSGCEYTQGTANAGDTFAFTGTAGEMDDYARVSFWIRSSVANEFADLKYGTDVDNDAIDNIATLAASDCTISGSSSSATMVAGSWYFCDVAVDSSTDASDVYFVFELDEVTELDGSDSIYVDRLIMYNDKIEIDIDADDIDTQANGAHGLQATLKQGSTTLATSYVAKKTSATAEGGNAKVVFYPISGTNSVIEIAKGTSKTFTVQLNTATLLAEDGNADDPLTFSMDLGEGTDDSTLTSLSSNGDIWWNDTNFSAASLGSAPGSSYSLTTPGIIKWFGEVTNSKFSSNTVKY